MTDEAIIGARIQALRLKRNISQVEVAKEAKEAGISRQTLINLIHGKGTLLNLLSILRAIGELERLSSLLEEVRPSPLQIVKMSGAKRF